MNRIPPLMSTFSGICGTGLIKPPSGLLVFGGTLKLLFVMCLLWSLWLSFHVPRSRKLFIVFKAVVLKPSSLLLLLWLLVVTVGWLVTLFSLTAVWCIIWLSLFWSSELLSYWAGFILGSLAINGLCLLTRFNNCWYIIRFSPTVLASGIWFCNVFAIVVDTKISWLLSGSCTIFWLLIDSFRMSRLRIVSIRISRPRVGSLRMSWLRICSFRISWPRSGSSLIGSFRKSRLLATSCRISWVPIGWFETSSFLIGSLATSCFIIVSAPGDLLGSIVQQFARCFITLNFTFSSTSGNPIIIRVTSEAHVTNPALYLATGSASGLCTARKERIITVTWFRWNLKSLFQPACLAACFIRGLFHSACSSASYFSSFKVGVLYFWCIQAY